MMFHCFNIVFLFTLLNLINQIGYAQNVVGGVPTAPSRELGVLDVLADKAKLFDSKRLFDRKPIAIGGSNAPAVTVTPTTTLNVTPSQGGENDSLLASASSQSPLDYSNSKFENMVFEDSNGNLRKGANVHCGTTHIAVSCANRKQKKKGGENNEAKPQNDENDEVQGDEDYDN